MKKQRYEYKNEAKQLMIGKYSKVIPVLLIIGLIQGLLSWLQSEFAPKYQIGENFEMILVSEGIHILNYLMQIIIFVVTAFFTYALIKMFIDVVRGNDLKIDEIIFSGLKTEKPVKSLVLSILTSLFVILWSLLLIIPGIIKAYAYSMGFYLLNRDSSLSGKEALDKSKDITTGYKMDLFVLDLSYLGWYLLGVFTLGILWLWVIPKHLTARTLYFDEIYEKCVAPEVVEVDEDQIIYEF